MGSRNPHGPMRDEPSADLVGYMDKDQEPLNVCRKPSGRGNLSATNRLSQQFRRSSRFVLKRSWYLLSLSTREG